MKSVLVINKCTSKAELMCFLVTFLPRVTPWLECICHGITANRSVFLFWEMMQLWKSQCFFRLSGVTLLWQMKSGYVGSGEKSNLVLEDETFALKLFFQTSGFVFVFFSSRKNV